VTHGVASGVSKSCLFAGFGASACHEAERIMIEWRLVNTIISLWIAKSQDTRCQDPNKPQYF